MRIAVAFVVVVLSWSPAFAQSMPPRVTSIVAVAGGGGTTWDDEGKIGSGPLAGGRVDWRLHGSTFIEASLDWLHHDRSDRFAAQGNSVLVGGSLMQRFGRGGVQPYALGGIVVLHHSGTFGFPDLGPTASTRSTGVGLGFGGGLGIRLGQRFEAGPEARFLIVGADEDAAPHFVQWVGGRFGVRF